MQEIMFIELSRRAQERIERDDPAEEFTWLARPYGVGYRLAYIDPGQEELFLAQEGQNAAQWLRVVWEDLSDER